MLNELKRKFFHLFTLVYAAGYGVLGREKVLAVLVPILILEGILELVRLKSPSMNQKLITLFGGIHRAEEVDRISGLFWTLLGTIVVMFAFKDPRVVYTAIGFLTFSDAAAALVGKSLGRHKYLNKSLEGSFGCFLTSLAVGLFCWDFGTAFLSALVVTVVEALPLPLNDNLWIPIISGCFLALKSINL